MPEKTVLVIGGGVAGLSLGCYARASGYRVRVFEQHDKPGGQCTSWQRKGYTVDGCIHWLMDSAPGGVFRRMYDEVGALDGNRLVVLDHHVTVVEQVSGRTLDFGADLGRLEAEMHAISPADRRLSSRFVAGCRALRGTSIGIPVPQELARPIDGFKALWATRRLLFEHLRWRRQTAGEVARRFREPFLGQAIANLFVPTLPVVALQMSLAQIADGRFAIIEGGSRRFSQGIARRLADLGGELQCGATVDRILVEDDAAVGIRLADGTEHRGDVIVSCADGRTTLFDWLGGRQHDEKVLRAYEKWPLFSPIVQVTWGVRRTWPGARPTMAIRLAENVRVGGRFEERVLVRVMQNDPTLAPAGGTVVQALIEANWDDWDALARDPGLYAAEKERLASELLARLEAFFPGIGAAVEMTDVATPHTWWRYTRVHRGAYEGFLPMPEGITSTLPRRLPGLRAFYMAGQWVEPGGGIPPAIYTARQVAQLMCREDGKEFRPPG